MAESQELGPPPCSRVEGCWQRMNATYPFHACFVCCCNRRCCRWNCSLVLPLLLLLRLPWLPLTLALLLELLLWPLLMLLAEADAYDYNMALLEPLPGP